MKSKLKSYSFWMSVSAGLVLLLNNFGKVFGFAVESEAVTDIVDSICGILILFGVITMPKNENENDMIENLKNETKLDSNTSIKKTIDKPNFTDFDNEKH